ncbi:hypothetical protein LOTGIDRAFT_231655 [Lottia gigantea]|uniref:Uncharacterized protein n=1 Tax=Lottia gigantea TaxID=225164 RepID=V4APV2_LOTGI|nr:hypothetical protein LOTGIDRAFT_231655 [Lottia gigantea]ESO96820.1 hypothetical protein LOTGIDRAFT_231655 [Lottia gigantea]
MEEDNFIHLLVKNLQMLCHDHLQFKQSLEITGHSSFSSNFVEIVKLEHLTGTAETDISVKQTEREKYEKGNILIESMVDDDGNQIVDEDLQKSLQDEDDMERMHADPGHVDMIDEAKEIPGNDDDDDDEEEDAIDDEDVDDDQITDCGFGEINITYRVNDVSELPSVNKKRGKSVAKIGERDFDEPYKKDLLKPNYSYFDQDEEDDGIEYTIVDMATKKGRPMLIDNIGFGYNIRRNTDKTVHWTCSLRNKQISCAAGVLQCNDKFKRNKHLHCHPPKPGLLTSTIIVAEARAQASNDPVTPTSLVVQRAMTVKGKSEDETFLPRTSNLKRMINRYRQCKREGGIPKKKARTDCVKVENLEIESQ